MTHQGDRSRSLRVVHLTALLELGGAERTLLDLCLHGKEDQRIVSLSDGRMRPFIEEAGVALDVADHPDRLSELFQAADLVNVHWPKFQPELMRAVLLAGRPTVFTIQWRSLLPELPGPVVCTSQNVYNLQTANRERRVLITNGVDPDRFPSVDRSARTGPVRIGRVCHPHKCAEYFWMAIHEVLSRCPTAEVVTIGGPPFKTERIEALGIRSDVPDLLRSMDLFAYAPHPYVGSHDLVVLEAMASGLPCVVSDVPCVNEAVEQSVSGFLTPYDDVTGFAEAIVTLIEDRELRSQLGRQAAALARVRFSIQDKAEQYSRVYERAMAERELPSRPGMWQERFGLRTSPSADGTTRSRRWRPLRWTGRRDRSD